MKYKVRKTNDLTSMLALHLLCMPYDKFSPHKDESHWIAYDETWTPVAFASAKFRKRENYVYFTRAGVLPCAQGQGLQKRLIKARLNWAKKIGADTAYTYTILKNYPSMLNLIKCGFKFWLPPKEAKWVGDDVHYFIYDLKKEGS